MKRTDITELFPDAPKESIDKLMAINGADVNAAKAELESIRAQLQQAQNGAELQEAQQKIAKLTTELDGMKNAESIRQIRAKVSSEKNVPAELLTGETEEACAQQADKILAFAKPAAGYPPLPDHGEARSPQPAQQTRDKFANWMQEAFPAQN